MLKVKVDGEQRREIVRQINRMTLLAISGGRVKPIESGIELPVAYGYSVRIELTAMDYYEVSRVFKRGAKEFIKGVRTDVDCFELSEAAYFASCYASYDEGEWELKR
jgi:hypothetical protein